MKVLYTASVLSHICQFHLPMMASLQEQGWEVHVAARDNLAEKNGLQLKNCDRFIEIPFQRSPKDKRNLDALKRLKQLLTEEYYDLIICNTPVCGILTRMAAKETRKKGTKVVYIAHGFHFYKGAPKKYWLLYPIEKFFADRRTDLLITINHEDYERAKKRFRCSVAHIYGVGVRNDRYRPATPEEQLEMRKKEGLAPDDFVISCAKELMFDNNQKTLIRACAKVAKEIQNLVLLLAGNGPDEQMLKDLTRTVGMDSQIRFLGYRTDLEKVIPCADLVVSCSYREGMPLNIIEAMLCARTIVASHNRGHDELIEDGVSGLLFDSLSVDQLAEAILFLYRNKAVSESYGKAAFEKSKNYTAEAVVVQMNEIIKTLIGEKK